ncbi:DUF6932 family protein [Paraburkholderia sp. MM5384-R2]|uniref:DUF6932 family protein n=1 Tax=Paraburkholderia sp. MM5384-R2 TaxID=2723097 RepID=UPI001610E552|nr:hypothetical protein [Paraburkholderia sp. MM5384-R2]MBB5502092.1 hypothetical protein [Paraburkholderia sp. MM5384-R2]
MLPGFNASLVLPPFAGESPTDRATGSPYYASMAEVVFRFGASEERRKILRGLLAYRSELRAAGFVHGFQWLDGSFCEDVERMRGRPPGDIDVVTYAYRPEHLQDSDMFYEWFEKNEALFNPWGLKARLHCEVFFIDMQKPAHYLVDDVRYWYGLFSHQRETFLWKGMVWVGLESNDDDALVLLG